MKHIHFSKRAVTILLSSACLFIFSSCSGDGSVSSAFADSAIHSSEPVPMTTNAVQVITDESTPLITSAPMSPPEPTTTDVPMISSEPTPIITPAPIISDEPEVMASGEYQFEVNEDDTITITKYTGDGGDVTIPAEIDGKKVTAIGNTFKEKGAFTECENLISVVIPDGVTEIQDNAFQSCHNLITVTIPASVTFLRNCAFDDCPNLQSVYFEGNAPETANYVFTYLGITTLYYHESTTGWTNPWYSCPTELY